MIAPHVSEVISISSDDCYTITSGETLYRRDSTRSEDYYESSSSEWDLTTSSGDCTFIPQAQIVTEDEIHNPTSESIVIDISSDETDCSIHTSVLVAANHDLPPGTFPADYPLENPNSDANVSLPGIAPQ